MSGINPNFPLHVDFNPLLEQCYSLKNEIENSGHTMSHLAARIDQINEVIDQLENVYVNRENDSERLEQLQFQHRLDPTEVIYYDKMMSIFDRNIALNRRGRQIDPYLINQFHDGSMVTYLKGRVDALIQEGLEYNKKYNPDQATPPAARSWWSRWWG